MFQIFSAVISIDFNSKDYNLELLIIIYNRKKYMNICIYLITIEKFIYTI